MIVGLSFTQDLLLSASEDSESELSETEQLQIMLELQYKRRKKWRKRLKKGHKVLLVCHCTYVYARVISVSLSW